MFINTLKRITRNPYLNILVALLLFYSGASEAWHEFNEMEEIKVGVHHGVILFSFVYILKTIPEIFKGLENLSEGMDHLKK
ncbi:MAG: hypothetical protein KJO08_07695 [Gammaproteobacteria bacterium]|nr:hypothetical protein [Gammaproteobacteria bacterium]NNJ83595.1 hypothetical protein [Gammaproteobacteria bacterium]